MNIELAKDLIGKPIQLRRKNGFILTGFIEKVVGDTLVFVTNQKTGYIVIDDIGTITETNRVFWMVL
jgi:hypothetical protein